MGGHVTCIGDMIIAYKILGSKPEGTETLGRLKHNRWEDNIKLDLKKIGCEDVDCIHLAQDRV
jgi:hypothetical protein